MTSALVKIALVRQMEGRQCVLASLWQRDSITAMGHNPQGPSCNKAVATTALDRALDRLHHLQNNVCIRRFLEHSPAL